MSERERVERSRVVEWITTWGGALALIISIVSSVYTFYSTEYQKPKEEALVRFQTSVSAIKSSNEKAMQEQTATSDLLERQRIAQALALTKVSLINEAERNIPLLDIQNLSPYDFLIIGNEKLIQADSAGAMKYADLATMVAKGSPVIISDIFYFEARAKWMEGPLAIKQARNYFQKADEALSSVQAPAVHLKRAALYGDMTLMEVGIGTCDQAIAYRERFFSELSKDQTSPEQRAALTQMLQAPLNSQSRCTFH